MSKYEQDIRNSISLRGSIGVSELANLLNVSDQTIRRIVKPMVDRGEVKKVHGAIVSSKSIADPPFLARMNKHKEAKIAIARRIAQLVRSGDSISIDTGSTSAFVAQALRQHHDLTIVTNSAFVASTLTMVPGNRVYMAGSELRNHDGAAFDRAAFATIASHHTDWAVLSASAAHHKRGFLVQEQCEVDMCIAMMQISEKRLWAVDGSKFTEKQLALALPSPMHGDLLVTDTSPKQEFIDVFEQMKIEVAN